MRSDKFYDLIMNWRRVQIKPGAWIDALLQIKDEADCGSGVPA
jgi:hypothetical protein